MLIPEINLNNIDICLHSVDHDMVVPFVATDIWIGALNLTVDDEWRPWFVDGQVTG